MSPSSSALWGRYRTLNPYCPVQPYDVFHFCDNAADADLCGQLVLKGIKLATASAVKELEQAGLPLPQPGDLSIVTDWNGEALAIIQTRSVELKRFEDVDAEFALHEGEGDLSLKWWREAHLAYYQRVLAGTGVEIDGSLMIVCERFERVF